MNTLSYRTPWAPVILCLLLTAACVHDRRIPPVVSPPASPAPTNSAEPAATFLPFAVPDGMVEVIREIPDIMLDIRYAGSNNFVGEPLDGYLAARAFLMPKTATALKAAQAEFRGRGYCLKLYDGYRPMRAERHMIRWAKAAGREELLSEGYLASHINTRRTRGHACGNAVDVTLIGPDGRELDMGTEFDTFSRDAWTMNASGGVRAHRLLLKSVMERHGFTNFSREWWHFNYRGEPGRARDDIIR
jgi:D-alanyl-D-alanine dipeptidase